MVQKEVENNHRATYWSEVSNLLERGEQPALTWSGLSQRGHVPTVKPKRVSIATSSTRSAFRRDTSMIWSGRAQRGQVAAVTWSDLVERRHAPALNQHPVDIS
ncbi:hypothetical protein F2Q69_00047954 [Brassica cretica]|uniref:Uncharacterized protein n=1 Tax=Brassica cretica TaxID=69181 RepID=A0A8S9Q1B4_BRACR|nr:hypothetical protein F2Q69_00047954 [Brassica cretica]